MSHVDPYLFILTVSNVEGSLAFYDAALKPIGAMDSISPGIRSEYTRDYYAAGGYSNHNQ